MYTDLCLVALVSSTSTLILILTHSCSHALILLFSHSISLLPLTRNNVSKLESHFLSHRSIRNNPKDARAFSSLLLRALDLSDTPPRQSTTGIPANDAVSLEQTAFNSSSTLAEYETACFSAAQAHSSSDVPPRGGVHDEEDEGIRIGSYTNCHHIASGLTSEVYRSHSDPVPVALKVIVPTQQNIEPHNPAREVRILNLLRDAPSIITLLSTFRDQEQRLVLAFPYVPYTLAEVMQGKAEIDTRGILRDVLRGLEHIHREGIIHRDIKPSAILLTSSQGGSAVSIADFGTAWHPDLSSTSEPASAKILDIGTGPYRAPEVLFGDHAYGPPVDMWATGVMLAEMIGHPLFESRPTHEDGNQLGLILSIFKTLGTPTRETWPEAKAFKVTPFELWTVFPRRPWGELLPDVGPEWTELIAALVRFDGSRATAEDASLFSYAASLIYFLFFFFSPNSTSLTYST